MKMQTLLLATALSVGVIAISNPAEAQREVFERKKPHVAADTGSSQSTTGAASSSNSGRLNPGNSGTVPTKNNMPDLVYKQPYPNGSPAGAPMSGFCGGNQGAGAAKTVVIPVRNNGPMASGPFTVRVTFDNAHPTQKVVEKAYNALPAGGSGSPATLQAFDIPNTAWQSGQAAFTVMIDSNKQVDEGNLMGEKNNAMKSKCVQPAM